MPHQHIRIEREAPSNERRPKRFVPKRPSDPRALGARLHSSLEQALEADRSMSGYDHRQLLKVRVESGFQADDLEKIPGVEVLSQEDKSIVLAFADAQGLENFEQRLTSLARNGKATRKAILFALQAFDNWTPADRTGPALATFDVPKAGSFVVDVELWPLVKPDEREAMRAAFEAFMRDRRIDRLDLLDRPSLLIYRVGTSKRGLVTYSGIAMFVWWTCRRAMAWKRNFSRMTLTSLPVLIHRQTARRWLQFWTPVLQACTRYWGRRSAIPSVSCRQRKRKAMTTGTGPE